MSKVLAKRINFSALLEMYMPFFQISPKLLVIMSERSILTKRSGSMATDENRNTPHSPLFRTFSIVFSYDTAMKFLEPPTYERHDTYRALSVLAQESDYIQAEVYKNSNFIISSNNRVLYYDCTNYYFEIEEEDDFRKYGKSKEHRPNPIVQMGLFMDGDGIPMAFDIFDGSSNEQPSLKPLEEKIIKNFGFDKFVVCTDEGLGSDNNRLFNDIEGRAFIVTQLLKKLKKAEREAAMDERGWRRLSDKKMVDISEDTNISSNICFAP